MKKVPLLPRYFRWIGLAIILCFILFLVFNALVERQRIAIPSGLSGGSPTPVDYSFPMLAVLSDSGFFKVILTDMYLTIHILAIQLGLSLIAFSRNKTEDEMINSIRLYSWSWAIISSTIFIIFSTLFVYDGWYAVICMHCFSILLLLYILIFHISIFKLNRRGPSEE